MHKQSRDNGESFNLQLVSLSTNASEFATHTVQTHKVLKHRYCETKSIEFTMDHGFLNIISCPLKPNAM